MPKRRVEEAVAYHYAYSSCVLSYPRLIHALMLARLCPQKSTHQAYLDSDVHIETNKKGVYKTRLQLRICPHDIGPSQLSRSLMVKSSPSQFAELNVSLINGNIFQDTSSVWPHLHQSQLTAFARTGCQGNDAIVKVPQSILKHTLSRNLNANGRLDLTVENVSNRYDVEGQKDPCSHCAFTVTRDQTNAGLCIDWGLFFREYVQIVA